MGTGSGTVMMWDLARVALADWEQDPDRSNNGSFRLPIEERMVKKFRRSAAGLDEQLPSDLRPPLVLQVCSSQVHEPTVC